jgi:hypothetical protein
LLNISVKKSPSSCLKHISKNIKPAPVNITESEDLKFSSDVAYCTTQLPSSPKISNILNNIWATFVKSNKNSIIFHIAWRIFAKIFLTFKVNFLSLIYKKVKIIPKTEKIIDRLKILYKRGKAT